ncbi:hypothetical protein NE237_033024 [Protea cynaroides]|uniref:Disease resistance protein Roq1-like winged-helix domain-containing protein n=1 Tax=Protea cynaroides TaxID=273540 RepID=A0A9Q0L4G4_9MAGN|nr:hypothetical protein NE237_033024 [Protea cynaroides]
MNRRNYFLTLLVCILNGYPLENTTWIFTHYKNEIKILIEKSLVKIGKNKELTMDNLLQYMEGRDIVCEEGPNDPGIRSRLWKYKEVMDVLAEDKNCTSLQSLPKLPSSLIILDAANCIALERVPDMSQLKYLEKLFLNNCRKLSQIEGLIGLPSLRLLYMHGCSTNLGDALRNKLVQDMYEHIQHLTLPEDAIPDRFRDMKMHKLKRRVGYFEMEGARLPNPGFEIIGLILWLVFEYHAFGINDIVWLEKIAICRETREDKVPRKRLEIKVKMQE